MLGTKLYLKRTRQKTREKERPPLQIVYVQQLQVIPLSKEK